MRSNYRYWAALLALILLAFGLRLHHIALAPLRGDEAFTVRYWADSPSVVLTGLAWVEPHPFGAFFGFWAWKSLMGSSEFAMRMLPALTNLLGVPSMYILASCLGLKRPFRLFAAFLWAVNPDLIWHSQDVRNYAIWSGLSVITLCLLLRSVKGKRRATWVLYIVFATLGLYMFFLETFVVVVHGLYVRLTSRRAWKLWLTALLIIGVLLIPWFGQIIALAGSGYRGTAGHADVSALFSEFLPALMFGEHLNSPALNFLIAMTVAAFFLQLALISFLSSEPLKNSLVLFLTSLLLIPAGLLVIISTWLNVFRPSYLLTITPAILLTVAYGAQNCFEGPQSRWQSRGRFVIGMLLVVPYLSLTANSLTNYYAPTYRKGPDWRELGTYLQANVVRDDALIVVTSEAAGGSLDPAFEYYYHRPEGMILLPYPGLDTQTTVDQTLDEFHNVWVASSKVQGAAVLQAFSHNGALLFQEALNDFFVSLYRSQQVKADEVEAPLRLSIGGGELEGYSLVGARESGRTFAVLLYWKNLPPENMKVFVHLSTPDESQIAAQNDHTPQARGRDVYSMSLATVLPGEYKLDMGLYDPTTNERLPITNAVSGIVLGDHYILTDVEINR
jgi:4-amino-4-deoxy-L-arabinose transferase-like glycosyltransferase